MKTTNRQNAFEVPNLRLIKVKFLSPTNYSGSRVKIYETKRYSDDATQSKVYGYDYSIGDILEQAYQILARNGFNVVCRYSEYDNYGLLCDNWSDEFVEIKDLK